MNTTHDTATHEVPGPLAPGSWRVDPRRSSAIFSARGFWGTVPVTGSFSDLSGTATLGSGGRFTGELVIPAGTLSTRMWVRDRHLKSRAFFHVRRYTEISFVAHKLTTAGDGHMIHGRLCVRDRSVELELPVELVEEAPDRVALNAAATLDREALGVGHSPVGMIRGRAELQVHIVLESAK